jgi:hypothetical protein
MSPGMCEILAVAGLFMKPIKLKTKALGTRELATDFVTRL